MGRNKKKKDSIYDGAFNPIIHKEDSSRVKFNTNINEIQSKTLQSKQKVNQCIHQNN